MEEMLAEVKNEQDSDDSNISIWNDESTVRNIALVHDKP